MEQTVGQLIKWDFKANPSLAIKDTNGNLVYFEISGGYWEKWEYDDQGNTTRYETSWGTYKDFTKEKNLNL